MNRLVIGNWKMQRTVSEAEALAKAIAASVPSSAQVSAVLCPSFTALEGVSKAIAGTACVLGAQDVSSEKRGALTGEVGIDELAELGVGYVLLGHSERRHILGENMSVIARKLAAVTDSDIVPVLCVGETEEERAGGGWRTVLEEQLISACAPIKKKPPEEFVVAYEPVWAIGTGTAAKPADARAAHLAIRKVLCGIFTEGWVDASVRILYGGSVDPSNAEQFFAEKEVNGVLLGGASLQADTFSEIVKLAVGTKQSRSKASR